MRGRVAVLSLLFLVLFSAAAVPQCGFAPLFSGQTRSSVLDVAVDGNELWTATSYGVQLLDRLVDPPAVIASIAVPGVTRRVRAQNGTAYVASGSAIVVVRKNGNTVQLVRSIDAGGTVNDLAVTPLALFAATSNGIVAFDLLNPQNPSRLNGAFETSERNVLSLALTGSTLYAADGDSSVEAFAVAIPASPQRIGALQSQLRAISVRATTSGRIYVSDGQQSDIFLGSGATPSRATTIPFGTSSVATITGDVVFAAGNDRRLHAIDLTLPGTPVELFEADLAPTGGTINRISALQVAGGRLYAAAGDMGLLTYDFSAFGSPFPVRSIPTAASTSVYSTGDRVFLAGANGGLSEAAQTASGSVTTLRNWAAGARHLIHDFGNNFLFTSSGASLTQWTLASSTPVSVWQATFRQPIRAAAAIGTNAYALLEDGTLWTASLADAQPTPRQVDVGTARAQSMARSGTALVTAQINDNGTTSVRYYANQNFAAPAVATIEGAATSGVTLSGTRAAVFTFRGISLIDFPAATVTLLPQSNTEIPKQLVLAGQTLFSLTSRELVVWDTVSRAVTRRFALPAEPAALHVAEGSTVRIADIATSDGLTVVSYDAPGRLPAAVASTNGNVYYRKVAAAGDRLYLFDGRVIDVFTTTAGPTPRSVSSLRVPSIVDFAASTSGLYTLASGGVVTAFGIDGGTQLAQATINEGTDVQPLAIHAVGDALWVSIAKGCLTGGGCEKKTLVFDARTLVRGATLNGGATDVTVSGTRAYALFDLPSEVRVYDLGSPLQPAALASRAAEGTQPPVSISAVGGTVYVLGEKLYAYAESGLAKTGEQLAAYAADPTTGVAYIDQRLRIDGGCAIVSGRALAPQLFATGATWSASTTPAVPAIVKSVASTPGRLYLLTDYSLEIWSTSAATKPPRRHVAR